MVEGDYAEAEDLVRRAAAIRFAYHGENSPDQAQHIGLAPQAPEYLYWLGRSAVQRGNIPLANEQFEKALQLLQQHPTPDAILMDSLQSEMDALNYDTA